MRRTLAAAALAASLAVPSPAAPFDRLWNFLSAFWEIAPGAPATPPTKAGCIMDPSGQCSPAPQPQSFAGCGMDPSGQCQPGS